MGRKPNESRRRADPTPPLADARRFAPENRRRLSGPGLRAFLSIADHWGLNEAECLKVLGRPARSTYHRWRAKAREGASFALPAAVLLRISAVLAIHKALSGLFDATEAGAWLREPHGAPIFGGQPPLTRITEGTQEGPLLALGYLDALCQGICAAPASAGPSFPPYGDDDILIV